MFAIAIIVSFASADALKFAAINRTAQGKPEVQTKGDGISVSVVHVGMLPDAPGVVHQEGFLHGLTTGLRGAMNMTFATGSGISISDESHYSVGAERLHLVEDPSSKLVEDALVREEPASDMYWGIPTVTHGNLREPGTFGETSPAGWACISLFFVVWMIWGYELLWTTCVQRKACTLNVLAHVIGGVMLIKAFGVLFGSYAQLTATCLFSFLLVINVLFFMLWEVARKFMSGAKKAAPPSHPAWTSQAPM